MQLRGFLARHGVFLRVFCAISASALVAIALSGAAFWFVVDRVWEDIYERDLGDVQSQVEQSIRTDSLRSLQSRLQRDESIGLVVLQGFRPVGTPPPRWMMQQLNRARRSDAEELNRRMQRYVHSTFEIDGAQYRVILMPNVRSVWKFAKPVGWLFALSALVLASAWIAWMLTRPLRVMSHSTQRLAEGDLQARVPEKLANRQDAIGQLGSEFNRMASWVDGLLTSQHQLLRDVSHELRTPLARLQVALTMAQDDPHKAPDMLARAEAELGRLDNLIGQVLSLSRLQSGADTLDFEALDLLPLLESLGENAEFEFADKGVRVTMAAASARVHGDSDKLSSAFENILRNAMRYSPDNGVVELRVASRDNIAEISIADRGPGVDEARLPRLFEAFYRADDARDTRTGGHGVGLAIAREAVLRHGGSLLASNREGGGLVVTVCLPTLT